MPDQLSRERSTTILFYGCIFLLGYLLYLLLQPFLTPLAWAAIFAAFFYKKHKKIEARAGKTVAASIGTAAVTIIIVVPFVLVGFAFIQEATQTIRSINLAEGSSKGFDRLQVAWSWLQRQSFGRNLEPLDQYIRQGAERAAGFRGGASVSIRHVRARTAEPHHQACGSIPIEHWTPNWTPGYGCFSV
jgi:predicted PurR-regulated permease PerM